MWIMIYFMVKIYLKVKNSFLKIFAKNPWIILNINKLSLIKDLKDMKVKYFYILRFKQFNLLITISH